MSASIVITGEGAAGPPTFGRRPLVRLLRRSLRLGRTWIGIALVLLVLITATIGPFVAPHDPSAFVGPPFSHPSADAWLGTDTLGRDVLSRFLWGGRTLLGLAGAATAIGIVLGVSVGLVAAYSRPALDELLMRLMDVIVAFPAIVLALLCVTTVGPKLWLVVLAVSLSMMPRVARVARGASFEIVESDFVHAAEAMGEPRMKILAREILPNVTGPILVEVSLRLTYAIGLIAALGFLGFGHQPPASDWGRMISENRDALAFQPWGVVLPVIAIALLTVGAGVVADGLARAAAGIDRSADE